MSPSLPGITNSRREQGQLKHENTSQSTRKHQQQVGIPHSSAKITAAANIPEEKNTHKYTQLRCRTTRQRQRGSNGIPESDDFPIAISSSSETQEKKWLSGCCTVLDLRAVLAHVWCLIAFLHLSYTPDRQRSSVPLSPRDGKIKMKKN